jgi:hypothetical protein
LGYVRRLTALSVSIALLVSTHVFAFSASAKTVVSNAAVPASNADSVNNEIQLFAVTATVTAGGVLLRWRTSADFDNVGFNVYRVRNGERARANGEIIPGGMFAPHLPASTSTQIGHSYSWLDRSGSLDATYFVETVSADGGTSMHEPVTPKASKTNSEFQQTSAAGETATAAVDLFDKSYPVAEALQPNRASGTLQEQWAIAAQPALKIAIKKDGWYRVTQPQMASAGFNTAGDIRNLRLFVDANEVAIGTSQSSGAFGSADYLEFYGRGLDATTTDTRIYYLISGNTPGKRVIGQINVDADPDLPPSSPEPTPMLPVGSDSHPLVFRNPIFFSWVLRDSSEWTQLEVLNNTAAPPQTVQARVIPREQSSAQAGSQETRNSKDAASAPSMASDSHNASLTSASHAGVTKANPASPVNAVSSPAVRATIQASKGSVASDTRRSRTGRGSRKRKKVRHRKAAAVQRHHAALADNFAPANFDSTFQLQERLFYLSNLLNGDQSNFFGRVVSTTTVNQTVVAANPDPNASATLEFALQGVANQFSSNHQVNVSFNGVQVGSLTFSALEHAVRTIAIPQVLTGNNTVTFTRVSTGEVSLVDYVKLTYRHRYTADSGSLKFNLRGSQTLVVDGFSTPSVQLIDYTDPLNVQIFKPEAESSGSGYAITVPTSESRSKDQRLLFAFPTGQFDAPASLSLNQPSTLNLSSGSFLIISYKDFIPAFSANVAPINSSFIAQRTNQGFAVVTADIEDVYDEFGYGVHGPQAVKEFLRHAATHWSTPPRYIILAGDASFDPRKFQLVGDDFVPTKLVDTIYSEAPSDDWLADFEDDNGDHIANIPVGRLPIRNVADANLIVSKIVNFTPVQPEAALLVADDPGTPAAWDFETASDDVQALLPPSIAVQKSYRRQEVKLLTGTITTNSNSNTVTGSGTLFTSEVPLGMEIATDTGQRLGTVNSIANNTSLTLNGNSQASFAGAYGKQDDATATAHIIAGFQQGRAIVNYSGHGNVDVWTSGSVFTSANATALTNSKLPFVIVMDCLNGYYIAPSVVALGEAFLLAPNGGAVAAFASSGLTITFGQRQMELELYRQLYGATPIALGDAIKIAKNASSDPDVRSTWIYFGDPSIKIR